MSDEPQDPQRGGAIPPEPAPAQPAAPGANPPPNAQLKDLTAKEVLRNVGVYVALVSAFLLPLLVLTYIFASQAQWFAVKRLHELTAGRCFTKAPQQTGQREWMKLSSKAEFPNLEGKLEFSTDITPQPTQAEKDRIQCQFDELLSRTQHHGSGLSKLFGLYTSSVIMSGVTSAVAAIVLLFITSSGWNNAHNYAKAIFLVAIATAGYYVAFPKIFVLDDNMSANKEHFLAYVAVTDEVCSYVATGEGYTLNDASGPSKPQKASVQKTTTANNANPKQGTGSDEIVRERYADPAGFITYIDYELKRWNTVAVGFDASKNPDFKKLLDDAVKTK